MRRRVVVGLVGLVGVVAFSAVSGPLERDAGACSCVEPHAALVDPDRVDDAPLNARIRLETPASGIASAAGGTAVLRVHHGSEAPTSSRLIAPGGWVSMIELTPSASLAPATQYEVALLDPTAFPSATVIGTFRTGDARDTVPPRIDAMGPAVAFKNSHAQGAACQVPGPWVIIEGVRAEDPGRPKAQLVFGVWLADRAGNVDVKNPPTAMVTSHDGTLRIGQTSLCDRHSFPMPKTPFMQLGIAALDEAGNVSAVRRVRVDLAGARQR